MAVKPNFVVNQTFGEWHTGQKIYKRKMLRYTLLGLFLGISGCGAMYYAAYSYIHP